MAQHDQSGIFSELSDRIPGVVYQFLVTSAGCWQFTYISPRIEVLYEVTAEDVLRDHEVMTSCIIPEDRPSHLHSVEQAVTHCAEWAHLHRIRTPNGNLKWIHAQASPERRSDGSVLWHGILTDVTWYMHKEAELFGLMQRFELSLSKRMQVLLSDTNWLEEFRRETLTLKSRYASSHSAQQSNLNKNIVKRGPSAKDYSAETSIPDGKIRSITMEKLSGREDHVLRLISRGLTSKQIALELGLSVTTVSAHRRNIKKKLQMKTSLEIARYALLKFPFDADDGT